MSPSGPRSLQVEPAIDGDRRFVVAIHGDLADSSVVDDWAAGKTALERTIDLALKRLRNRENAQDVARETLVSLVNVAVFHKSGDHEVEPDGVDPPADNRENYTVWGHRKLGSVGAVVLDIHGHLSAASTSGCLVTDSLAVTCRTSSNESPHAIATKIAGSTRDGVLRDAVKTTVSEFTQHTGTVCSVIALDKTGELAVESSARLFVTASGSGTLGDTIVQREVNFVPNTVPILPCHEFMRDGRFVAGAYRYPITSGHAVVLVEATSEVTTLNQSDFSNLFQFTRKAALALVAHSGVHRCALASDGTTLHLIPLHGVSNQWCPITSSEREYHTTFPGYLSSRSGPKAPKEDLNAIQSHLISASGLSEPFDRTFHGDPNDQNLFARIVRGELEQWRIWENDSHVAFLTPFGNMPGYTVLVPRRHLPSDVFALSEEDYAALVDAVYLVAGVVKRGLGVTRVGVFFEGFEIDYTHAKLIPVHGNGPLHTVVPPAPFWKDYPGFVTTQPGPLEADMSSLNALTDGIRKCIASSVGLGSRVPEVYL